MIYLHHKSEYTRMRGEVNEALDKYGLNVEQFLALVEMDGKKTLQDIADNTCTLKPSLSRMRKPLIKGGFARELKSNGDRREIYMKATAKGKRIVEKHLNEVVEILGGGKSE